MNKIGIAWLDDRLATLLAENRNKYMALIVAMLVATVVLVAAAALSSEVSPTLEALVGGTAGITAFVAARATIMYNVFANPQQAKPYFRLRLGYPRVKKVVGLGGLWLITLFLLSGQGIEHPAFGSLTVLVALTLFTLANRTRAEELAALSELAAAEVDEELWNSDELFEDDSFDDEEIENFADDYDEDEWYDLATETWDDEQVPTSDQSEPRNNS